MNPSHPASFLAALLAVVVAGNAQAQTGRPSEAPAACPEIVAVDGDEVGSYARYLMLNGVTRDAAVKAARNIDHPARPLRLAARAAPSKPDHASTSTEPGTGATPQ